jgi:enoyl-CoA hydratase/carnithine racemase
MLNNVPVVVTGAHMGNVGCERSGHSCPEKDARSKRALRLKLFGGRDLQDCSELDVSFEALREDSDNGGSGAVSMGPQHFESSGLCVYTVDLPPLELSKRRSEVESHVQSKNSGGFGSRRRSAPRNAWNSLLDAPSDRIYVWGIAVKYNTLIVERTGHTATVALNRPDRLNALNGEIMTELEAVADEFRADTETRAIIFRGQGKHFSAGADLKPGERTAAAAESLLARHRGVQLGQRMTAKLQAIPQITIAAIHGAALGGGAVIPTAMDFRIGAEGCFVSYPEINLGMSLSWYGLPLCLHLVGPARAKRLVILGQRETAETLLEWGFLDEVVPAEKLLERAQELADAYAAQPPMVAQMIKRSVNALSSALDQSIMHMDGDQLLLTQSGKDAAEGRNAFLEKRDAEFTGD